MVRIKPTPSKVEKRDLTIVMDERIDKLDEKMIRVVIAAVEIEQEELDKCRSLGSKIRHNMKNGNSRKFHFTDLKTEERKKLIDFLDRLDFKCKTHIGYFLDMDEESAKKVALRRAIRRTQKTLSKTCSLKFLVEYSEGYANFIKQDSLVQDKTLSIIADTMAFIVANRLSYAQDKKYYERVRREFGITPTDDKAKNKQTWFNRLSDHNRLECYFIHPEKPLYLSRENRLAKVSV